MSTEKQIQANRPNALKSTRPKSDEGKARTRMNAVRHGLTAEHAVLPHEDPRNDDEIRAGMSTPTRPGTPPSSPWSKSSLMPIGVSTACTAETSYRALAAVHQLKRDRAKGKALKPETAVAASAGNGFLSQNAEPPPPTTGPRTTINRPT